MVPVTRTTLQPGVVGGFVVGGFVVRVVAGLRIHWPDSHLQFPVQSSVLPSPLPTQSEHVGLQLP